MRERYFDFINDDLVFSILEKIKKPIRLTSEEFNTILRADIPESLEEVRETFLLQCALGCRCRDLGKLSQDNISVTEKGIPYVHYIPDAHYFESKDLECNTTMEEVAAPLMKFAFDIIKENGFTSNNRLFGYKYKLRELFRFLNLDREVYIFNNKTQEKESHHLYDVVTPNIAKRVHEDFMIKHIAELPTSGLRKGKKFDIKHYKKITIADKFKLLNSAFNQPSYKVDDKLNVIEETETRGKIRSRNSQIKRVSKKEYEIILLEKAIEETIGLLWEDKAQEQFPNYNEAERQEFIKGYCELLSKLNEYESKIINYETKRDSAKDIR